MRFALTILLFVQFSAEAESRFQKIGDGLVKHFDNKAKQEALTQGNAAAAELCNEIAPGDSWDALVRSNCLETVSKNKISDAAVELCRQMNPKTSSTFSTDDRLECLEIIAERKLSDATIKFCSQKEPESSSSFTSRDNRLECLKNIENTQDETSAQTAQTERPVQIDTPVQSESKQAKNEAIEFCRHEVASHYKDDCLEIIAPAHFVDRGALQLCKNQPSHSQTNCLSVIVNKEYVPSLIEECTERDLYHQIDCLSEYGSPITANSGQSVITIVIQNGNDSFFPECKYENIYGVYPEGGGCSIYGCWMAGGGCNIDGCWYPGGHCNIDDCAKQAPETGICL